MNRSKWLLFAVVVAGGCAPAQETPAIRRTLEPWAVARTGALSLESGQSISVTPEASSGGEFSFSVEVYGGDRDLVGRDDPESDATAFEWSAPRKGQYDILVRNLSGASGAFTVRIYPPGRPKSPQPPQDYAVVKVFYATNRVELARTAAGASYGSELRPQDDLAFGIAKVSVPRVHKMGELEGPAILRLEFREDPQRHIVLLSAEPEKPAAFFQQLSGAAGTSPRREAFVFVHGFACTFEDAARRAGQMAYDLKFQGAPILYSWPTQGEVEPIAYNKDGRNAELSAGHLRSFLERLVASAGIKSVHLLAHSMGNRVVTAALDSVARDSRSSKLPKLQQVVLMAPDIDAEVFRRLASRIRGVPSGRISLYASSADEALRASQTFAGYPRAGQAGAGLVVVPGVDTIDASLVKTSLIGFRHSYYADNRAVLMDLFYMIRGTPPDDRGGLFKRQHRLGAYWEIAPSTR
jgi:esterase/lipase superfamily enzyme